MAKVNITMDDRLLEKIDIYADENFMTRSGMIALGCTQFLNQQEAFGLVKRMSVVLDKIADTGTVDADTMKELEDFERICKLLVSQ